MPNFATAAIEQTGENIRAVTTTFPMPPNFRLFKNSAG